MSRAARASLLALGLLTALTVASSSASASTIRAAGNAYTGPVNIRLSSANFRWTPSTGIITCTSSTGTNPRLGSFGTGAVTSSSITTTPSTHATLSRLSMGNPLLANSTNVHDANTTVFTAFATTPNSTPRCPSTIAAISGGCVFEARPQSPFNAIQAQDVTSPSAGVLIRLTTTLTELCMDGSGNAVICSYTTGSTPGTPGPISSNVISYNASGSTSAATAVFTNQTLYRSSGSTWCPATTTFSASYQLYTGTVYPGGNPVYFTNP